MLRQILVIGVAISVLPQLLYAGEPQVIFEDSFDGKLGDGWSWLRESPGSWRINDGALEILVKPEKARTVSNALVRKMPDRTKAKFVVEVTITFTTPPTKQFEQGGITLYQAKRPVFKLVHEHIDGKDWIIPGRKPAASAMVQLRLIVEGEKWTAQYRENAKGEFLTAASGKLPPAGEDEISIQCYDGQPDAEHWIRFDDFRILELKG